MTARPRAVHWESTDSLTVTHHRRPWRVHEFLTSHRGLILLLAAVDMSVAGYLLLTPAWRFAQEDVWRGALKALDLLGLPPTTTPLGIALALVGAGAWCGLLGVRWIARISLLTALAPWGLIATSFLVAWMQTGIGYMTANLIAAVVLLHLASVGHFPPARRP